jgi:hypothetical protein
LVNAQIVSQPNIFGKYIPLCNYHKNQYEIVGKYPRKYPYMASDDLQL